MRPAFVNNIVKTNKIYTYYVLVIRCGYIGTISNGKVFLDKTSYGGIATFKCDDGYEMIGEAQKTCGLNGKWSGVNPECASRVVVGIILYTHISTFPGTLYCSKLITPAHSTLVYATEKGHISNASSFFHTGTLAEVQCENGYHPSGDNLITCLKDATWDNTLPECIVDEVTIPNFPIFHRQVPDRLFWRNLHTYLFFGCVPEITLKRSILCDNYNSNLTDLSTLTTLDSIILNDADHKLLDLFQRTIASINFHIIDINNFFQYILYQNETDIEDRFDATIENALRITLCFYMTMFDKDPSETEDDIPGIVKRLRRSLFLVVQPIYEKFLEDSAILSRKPMNAIQAIIASKEREKKTFS